MFPEKFSLLWKLLRIVCVCVLGGGRDWYSVYLFYMTCVYVCVHKCVHVCLGALATEKWEWETQGILLF